MTKKIDALVDEAMSQAQVFASAWSLVGGPFDFGDGLENAEVEKKALRALIADLLSASIADTAGAACVDCQENCQTCTMYKAADSNRTKAFDEFCNEHIDGQDTVSREWLWSFVNRWFADTAGAKQLVTLDDIRVLESAICDGRSGDALRRVNRMRNALAMPEIAAAPEPSVADNETFAELMERTGPSSVADAAGAKGYAFRSDGKLWVTQSLAVAERWKAQGFEITPVTEADAAGASEDDALEKIDREKALRVSGHFDIGINNRMAYRDGWNDCVAAIKKESGND